MRHLAAALGVALAIVALAATAQADPYEYGIRSASASTSTAQAGAHPDFSLNVALRTEHEDGTHLPATTRTLAFDLPPGLLANPEVLPKCTAAELLSSSVEDPSGTGGCPQDSQVGVTEAILCKAGCGSFLEPIYNMVPAYGEPARLGFIAEIYPVMVDTEVRPDREYGVTAEAAGLSSLIPLLEADTVLWGVPADPSHDSQRDTPYEAFNCGGSPCTAAGGVARSSSLLPAPFMLNPTRCGVPFSAGIRAVPYSPPDLEVGGTAALDSVSGCGALAFEPRLSIALTSTAASTGTGVDIALTFPGGAAGLEHPTLLAEDEQRRVVATMPEGVTVNPSQANGLEACSEASFAGETLTSTPGQGCPAASKIGTATALSPLLADPVTGSLYVAKPYENPFHSLIAVYLVLKLPARGILVKLAGKVSADPETGQINATFGDAPYPIPQLPVTSFQLHFREGVRSPLITPPSCGTYSAVVDFASWGGHAATAHPSFQIDRGAAGASCPSGPEPFAPGFEAGAINNDAGSFSPYQLRYFRADDDQFLRRFSTGFPPGALAKLAGVGECSATQLATAAANSGAIELAAPSCPVGAQIGDLLVGAGVGPALTYVAGRLYLAGPYRSAPLSIAAVVPAVAGPFDLGTVVSRLALRIDPETGRAEVDRSRSDPLPTILDGVPLRVRDVRVHVDRRGFTTNPTSCDLEAFSARLWGAALDPPTLSEDISADLSARFQAANCSRLPFEPRLSLILKGPTKRTAHPRLIADLRAKPGEANIARAQVKLPKAAILDQAHIGTVCTRVQFAAQRCPGGSVYGRVWARTPLLDYKLQGRVYLRSSPTHLLPDLVAELHGPDSQPIEITLVGKTDSVKGALRNTFEAVPDAPVSHFHLELFGGNRGLIELSTGLCARPRASVKLVGHNGKAHTSHPIVRARCRKDEKRERHG